MTPPDTKPLRELPLAEAAQVYVGYGWFLLPVEPGGKAPYLDLLRGIYADSRTTHLRLAAALPVEVEYWFENEPTMNVGVFPSAGLVIVDIDKLEMLDPELPTPTASSGREGGGKHLYFTSEEVVKTSHPAWGDINPAHAVLPGSVHESGRRYQWLDGLAPDEVPFMDYAAARDALGVE